MTPELFIESAIKPAYTLLPENMESKDATAWILAVCLQETAFRHRVQVVGYDENKKPIRGPGRSYGQFEMGGGLFGVLRHEASRDHIRVVLDALNYDHETLTSYTAIEHNDVLCAAYCRLLLWTHPDPLPRLGEDEVSWQYYLWLWRPKKKDRRADWIKNFDEAWRIVS